MTIIEKTELKAKIIRFIAEAKKINSNQQYAYGMNHYSAKEYLVAEVWFRLAVQKKHMSARHVLGWMYYEGQVTSGESKAEAMRLLQLAAWQGYATGQFDLGWMYLEVVKDYREAYIWLKIGEKNAVENATTDGIQARAFYGKEKILYDTDWEKFLTPEEIESAKQEAKLRFDEIKEQNPKG